MEIYLIEQLGVLFRKKCIRPSEYTCLELDDIIFQKPVHFWKFSLEFEINYGPKSIN